MEPYRDRVPAPKCLLPQRARRNELFFSPLEPGLEHGPLGINWFVFRRTQPRRLEKLPAVGILVWRKEISEEEFGKRHFFSQTYQKNGESLSMYVRSPRWNKPQKETRRFHLGKNVVILMDLLHLHQPINHSQNAKKNPQTFC